MRFDPRPSVKDVRLFLEEVVLMWLEHAGRITEVIYARRDRHDDLISILAWIRTDHEKMEPVWVFRRPRGN